MKKAKDDKKDHFFGRDLETNRRLLINNIYSDSDILGVYQGQLKAKNTKDVIENNRDQSQHSIYIKRTDILTLHERLTILHNHLSGALNVAERNI